MNRSLRGISSSILPDAKDIKIEGKIDVVQTKFIWIIEDFKKKAQKDKSIASPSFIIPTNSIQAKWELKMYFDGRFKKEEYLSIYALCSNYNGFKVTLEFSVVDIFNKEVYKALVEEDGDSWGVHNFIKKDEILNTQETILLHRNRLTVICTITTSPYIDIEKNKNNYVEHLSKVTEFNRFLKLDNTTFSDVVFTVNGREIHAHKSVIANESAFLEEIFTYDMMEVKRNRIEIEDTDYDVMYDLLGFIYSGNMPVYANQDSYEKYKTLMVAANKYEIKNLKLECEKKLAICIEVNNVFECLNLADEYNAIQLKKKAIEYIVANGEMIIETPSYREFGHLHPEICCEVFRTLIMKRKRIE